jgi:uncharacterized protein (DUF58 family)
MTDDEILYYMNLGLAQTVSESTSRQSAQQRSGSHVSAFRGSGFDYDDSRAYQSGDDLRKLNWRLMARTSQLFTRVYQEEREASVMLVIDRRAPMRFGTRKHLKVTRAVQLACYLAGLSLHQASSVGITLLQADSVQIQPQRSHTRVRDGLASAAAACPPLVGNTERTTLSTFLSQLQLSNSPGSRLILISDFHDLKQTDRAVMAQLTAQHQLQALQVLDPIELSLPDAGVWLVDDYSEATAIKVNADDRVLKEQYRDAMQAHLAYIESVFSACRVPFHRVYTNEPFNDVLRRIGYA